ncbi:hypothetical protein [Streptomyces sp. NPDC056525]|uniref:hypothetical protein n=1 Tax=unclassified Streptomyces TaxID=2593676 RepID=UPI0036BB0DC8
MAADLDDIAALHVGRGDLDRGGECTTRVKAVHEAASGGVVTEWQEQAHAS